MKSKYCFILMLIFLILFSLATVTAAENVTDDAVSLDDTALSDDDADVSVDVDVKQVEYDGELNPPGSVLPWMVTVNGTGGTAHDVEAHVEFSNNLEYVAHEATVGEYNSTTGIWDIGNLSSSDNASLTVWTRVLGGDSAYFTAIVTFTSNNGKLHNYEMTAGIEIIENRYVGPVSKPDEVPHYIPYPSEPKKHPRKNSHVEKSDDPISHHISPGSIVNDGVERGNGTEVNSTSNVTSVSKSIIKGNANPQTLIKVYDYTQIPLLVFAIFLIALVALVGVDKIKS